MSLEELERAVVTSWSPEALAVYADALQMAGDLRGELIAIELALAEASRPHLEQRRDALLLKWLGVDPRGWRGVRFRYGFVDATSAELSRVLASPAARYLRGLTVTGTNLEIVTALRTLAASPRPCLGRLTVATRPSYVSRVARQPLVDAELAAALVATTPNLEHVDLTGHRLFVTLPHPGVRRLRVVGHDAIASLLEAGPALASVEHLFYELTDDPSGRIAFPPEGLPNTLFAAATLPALATLDLSANEQQRSWSDRHVAIFELLAELGVTPQLRELRVPALHAEDERDHLQHALALMPALDRLVVTSDRSELVGSLRHPRAQVVVGSLPGSIYDLVEHTVLGIRIDNHAAEHRVSMRRAAELVNAGWSELADDTRRAWLDLFDFLGELPIFDPYMYEPPQPAPFSVAVVRTAALGLGRALDDDPAWRALADALADTRERGMAVRRYAQ